MKYKIILLSILISLLSGNNFNDNLDNYRIKIKNLEKNFYLLKRKFINYNLIYSNNEIKLDRNYNPFFINKNNSNVNKKVEKNNKKFRNIKKKSINNENIIDITPLMILNGKAYIKYLIIDTNNKKIIAKKWIKLGEKIKNCKLIKMYFNGDLLFKCGKRKVIYRNSPKLNIKGKK